MIMVLIKNKLSIKHKRQTKLKVNPKKRKEAVATKAFSSGTINNNNNGGFIFAVIGLQIIIVHWNSIINFLHNFPLFSLWLVKELLHAYYRRLSISFCHSFFYNIFLTISFLFWCSECSLIALWVLYKCFLGAHWLLTDCWPIWAREMKI